GQVKRVWGADVVRSGPDNSDERQALTVAATGGQFTLGFGEEVTAPIAFDAPAATVESRLDQLASIGGVGGSVSVSGGPGDAAGSLPYLIAFEGSLSGGDQPQLTADGSALSGGLASALVSTDSPGGAGFEICEPAAGDVCKQAVSAEFGGALGTT